MASESGLMVVLKEVEEVLEEERLALSKLDAVAIETAGARKLSICERLRSLFPMGRPADLAESRALERVRATAQSNQLLLVHARSCVERALALATGQPAENYPGRASGATTMSVRVNFTG